MSANLDYVFYRFWQQMFVPSDTVLPPKEEKIGEEQASLNQQRKAENHNEGCRAENEISGADKKAVLSHS